MMDVGIIRLAKIEITRSWLHVSKKDTPVNTAEEQTVRIMTPRLGVYVVDT